MDTEALKYGQYPSEKVFNNGYLNINICLVKNFYSSLVESWTKKKLLKAIIRSNARKLLWNFIVATVFRLMKCKLHQVFHDKSNMLKFMTFYSTKRISKSNQFTNVHDCLLHSGILQSCQQMLTRATTSVKYIRFSLTGRAKGNQVSWQFQVSIH